MEHPLDVSDLEPCEPMERILAAIQTLNTGDYLRVTHRREPHLIYPMLKQSGFDWLTRATGQERYEIFIWHDGDDIAEPAVQEALAANDSPC